MIILTSMKMEDVERLQQVFAYMTDQGWIIPNWLIEFEKIVKQNQGIE